MLTLFSTKTLEKNVTHFINNIISVAKNFFIEIYESLLSLVEPILGKTAGGIFIIGLAFIIVAITAVKLINK